MIKWIFKWLLRLFLLAVVLVVIFFLSLNSVLRVLVEHNIRKQTGMDAEIGRFQLGLTEPTVTIQNLKIYNPPSFGGTPIPTRRLPRLANYTLAHEVLLAHIKCRFVVASFCRCGK